MYELIQLAEHDYYINCPARIGIVRIDDADVILIDSGSDKDAGKKAYRILQEKGWKLRAICNTHSHADHVGGNRFLQEKTGCKIYARGMECAYVNLPLLEPVGLYGGMPSKDLRHKFLMAQDSACLPLSQDVLPDGLQLLELPGHSFDMAGFLTKDGTAYIADCVCSEATLEKYGLSYLWDADAALHTLNYIQTITADRFVPAHADVVADIAPLANINIRSIEAVRANILRICAEPTAFEDILKQIFDAYGLEMSFQQYALIGSTIRSYISGMCNRGCLKYVFRENRMLWCANSDQQ